MIRVIIERHIASSLEGPYEEIAKKTLQKAVSTPGFISGESLKNYYNPNDRIILCNWRSIQDWQRWQSSDERKELLGEMAPMLETEEKITVLDLA